MRQLQQRQRPDRRHQPAHRRLERTLPPVYLDQDRRRATRTLLRRSKNIVYATLGRRSACQRSRPRAPPCSRTSRGAARGRSSRECRRAEERSRRVPLRPRGSWDSMVSETSPSCRPSQSDGQARHCSCHVSKCKRYRSGTPSWLGSAMPVPTARQHGGRPWENDAARNGASRTAPSSR